MTVTEFKKGYYSVLEVLTMLAQALIGFIPAYFAIDGLTKVSGLDVEQIYIKAIVWLFAIILEILGIAILKQATEAYLSQYGEHIPANVPIWCGVIYVGNMMLITTLHTILPDEIKALSVGLLCLMPVVGYVSSGMKSMVDEAGLSAEEEEKRQRELAEEERQRKWKIEDEERQRKQELQNKEIEMNNKILMMREEAKIAKRSTVVPKTVPTERLQTVERAETDESGTILERIANDGYKSYGSLSKDTGIPKTTVARVVSELVNAGKLHRIEDEGKVKFELNGYH